MAARLGLDTSDFVEKMKGVEGFSSASGQRIAAEMKRTSREGSESLRLFDEAIGVHLSRPLTRLITETFPGVAEGLASVLGGSAFIAIGAAAFEFGERLVSSVDKAQKKLEAVQETSLKVKNTFADTMEYFDKQFKDQSLTGIKKKLFDADFSQLEAARRLIDQLTESMQKDAKAAEAASGVWTKWLAFIGDVAHEATSSGAQIGVEKIDSQYETLKQKLDELSHTDGMEGTHKGADLLNKSLAEAEGKLQTMKADQALQSNRPTLGLGRAQIVGSQVIGAGGSTDEEIRAQEKYIGNLKHLVAASDDVEKSRKAAATNVRSQDAAAEAEKQLAAIRKIEEATKRERQEMDQLTKSIQEAFGKDDLVARFNVELNAQLAALNQLQAMAGAKGFQDRLGMSPDAARDFLIQANILRESEAQLKSFMESDQASKQGRRAGDLSFPFASSGTATPVLGSGSAADGQFAAFRENQRAQMEAIKKIFEEALTPQQRFVEKQRELDLLMKDSSGNFIAGERGALAYKQALKELTEQEIQMLNATGKVSDAIRAWGLEAQQKNIGKEIVGGMQSAESAMASSLTIMIEHHRNATEQLRQLWEGFFQSLTQKAISSGLDKLFGSIIGAIGGGAKGGASSGAAAAAAAASGPVPGFVGWFADGGDITPGGSFVSGEAGAEEVRLTAGGGAHVTPLGGAGGGSHAYYDMRGSVVSEDLMKRAEAHRLVSLSEQRMMQAIPSMQREIGLRKRPG
jgi:hypothetical protein